MRILYVEDNSVDIDLLKRHLKKTAPSIAVDAVRTQKEALSVLRGPGFNRYDLVLTDIRLPDGDGIAVLSHIRANSLPLAVVVITGQGDEETAVSVLKSGADDYISKHKGYLNRLPAVLEQAVNSHLKGEARRAKKIHVLYLEHNPVDIDLTLRHFANHAAHIDIDPISTAGELSDVISVQRRSDKIDVLLLDYRIPGANALELYKWLKHEANWRIPTVLISGKGNEEIATNALKLGIFDYVSKNQGYLFKLPTIIENAYYNVRFRREHEALRKSEAKYRSMMESFSDPIYICSSDLVVEYMNPAMMNRLGRETTDKSCYRVIHGLDKRCEWCVLGNVENGEIIEKDIVSPLDNRNYHLTSMPVFNENGTVSKMTIFRDTTDYLNAVADKEKAQAQLLQSQKMEAIGNLAGGIAHDFNNILASVIGFTELALDDVEKETLIADNLQEVYLAGKRAKELVRQILLFARKADEQVKPVQVKMIVIEVLRFIRSSIPSNIEIRQKLESNSFIMGNPTQVHQILMNLCTNAAHAMENDGGILEIKLTETTIDRTANNSLPGLGIGDYIELIVSDTGTGIASDIIDTIFDPYFTTKKPGEGTGMGLAMVEGIVDSYGGSISVVSSPGDGTTFTIFLPITNKRKASRPYKSQVLPSGSERILFIDDEVSITNIGSQILKRLGYLVTTRTSSVEALALFKSKPDDFDLVVTDMTMPDMTGDVLAVELMKIRPDIPIILCTGYSKKISDQAATEIGIKAFAYKPIVKADLAKSVRKVLDKAKGEN